MQDPPSLTLRVEPGSRRFETRPGTRLADALAGAGIPFTYPCAGERLCGRCRVLFEEGAPGPSEDEKRLLNFEEIASGVRLACCAVVERDARVRLPAVGEIRTTRVLDASLKSEVVIDPEVRRLRCDLPPSTLEKPLSDWQRVVLALPENLRAKARPTLEALREMPAATARAAIEGLPVTLTLRGNRVIEVECGDRTAEHVGVAVDLGTTTIAAVLVDMHSGAELAFSACMNPQNVFGFDVLSRIHAIQKNPAHLESLHRMAIEAIGGLIETMCREKGLAARNVRAMSLAGNTVMTHLFLRVDPRPLGQAPFAGTLRAGVRCEARELGLPIHPRAPVYALPCLGGFVGGDIAAGILATKLEQQPGVSVLVDIGTNGEVVVAKAGEIYAASSAAGPSFEGGKVRCGMIAREGAVERVRFDGNDFRLSTIGDAPPAGICGSGLIEAFARCVAAGLIAKDGRITPPGATADLPPALAARLRRDGEAGLRVELFRAGDGRPGIFICQADVREFQLAKGAVQTAIALALEETRTRPAEIARFLVAGAFGSRLNVEDAVALGLLPELPREKVFFIGNSSLEGARCVLLNRYERRRAERLAERVRLVELASRPEFQERFAAAMTLAPASAPQ